MESIDAAGTTFTYDGVAVGGITRYEIETGITPDVRRAVVKSKDALWMPGQTEPGTVVLVLQRNPSDPGQAQMELSRTNAWVCECVINFGAGVTRTFPGYVKSLPMVGNITDTYSARVIIKVAGPVT
jgi:hypothetical protein